MRTNCRLLAHRHAEGVPGGGRLSEPLPEAVSMMSGEMSLFGASEETGPRSLSADFSMRHTLGGPMVLEES